MYSPFFEMMSNNPLVSIIVPVFKVEQYLERCVMSIIDQTYKELEIILVDDGSPDKCGDLCDALASKDNRIIVIHQLNMGLPKARRSGYNVSSGEFIFFVDSDDYIASNCIEILVKCAILHQVDIVVAGILNVAKQKEISIPRVEPGIYNKNKIEKLLSTNFLFDTKTYSSSYPLYAWGKLIRKKLLEGYFEVSTQFRYWEDIPSTFFLMKKTQSFEIIQEKLYYYVIHSGQVTKKPIENIWHYYVDVWNYLDKNDENHFLELQLPQRIWWIVFATLNNITSKYNYTYFKTIFKLTRGTDIVSKAIKDKRKLDLKGFTTKILYYLYRCNSPRFYYIFSKYNPFILLIRIIKK